MFLQHASVAAMEREEKLKRTSKIGPSILLMVMAATFLGLFTAGCGAREGGGASAAKGEIPEATVRFGHEPYFDHTQGIIGMKKGWFKDVGITIEPDNEGIVVDGNQAISVFASGRVDVLSGSAQLLMPAVRDVPPYKMFFFADIFQGYAIMAQPDGDYKSFSEFVNEGMSPEEAYKATMEQMKGKVFAFPPEAAIKGFINLALEKGGVTLDDMETNIAKDQANVALMQSGRADFQVGGVPSRLTLEANGFKPILTSADLAKFAQPSANSEELRAVFHDGWLASDEWIEANHDTMLRMASVGFRINQFINENPQEAMSIHTPFLNSVAGTDFDNDTAGVAYESLDPFYPFERQRVWHLEEDSPFNGEYVIGSAIKLYEEEGALEKGEYTWEDFSVAHEVYRELLNYRKQADQLIDKAESKNLSGEKAELLEKAKFQYEIFNYLDAKRFAEAAVGE
jgi:ABC-type nitrate/sulfonate/bicarbonate transport system substrate-binding protein